MVLKGTDEVIGGTPLLQSDQFFQLGDALGHLAGRAGDRQRPVVVRNVGQHAPGQQFGPADVPRTQLRGRLGGQGVGGGDLFPHVVNELRQAGHADALGL